MKIPAYPPKIEKLAINEQIFISLMSGGRLLGSTTEKGEYLHWDKLRSKQPRPHGLSAEQWWFATKIARRSLYKHLPFTNNKNKPFLLAIPAELSEKTYLLDRQMPVLQSKSQLEENLAEEAINSSQLEGAATTRRIAKEMIRTQRKPKNNDERMILNNYHAMQYIQEIKDQPLTIDIILKLHKIVTKGTLPNPKDEGRLRKKDDIEVTDHSTGETLHTPPKASELKKRLEKICDFANLIEDYLMSDHMAMTKVEIPLMDASTKTFIHPLIRGIILHFMLAYDHPFVDGNGRTARALFYWYMARQKYSFIEMISISQIIKDAQIQYARAFLYTETDENDMTYFVFHQMDVIIKAWNRFVEHINKQRKEDHEIEQHFEKYPLNERQLALIRHGRKNPQTHYLIDAHKQSQKISYDTARTDLLKLVEFGLFKQKKVGKAFVFIASDKLK